MFDPRDDHEQADEKQQSAPLDFRQRFLNFFGLRLLIQPHPGHQQQHRRPQHGDRAGRNVKPFANDEPRNHQHQYAERFDQQTFIRNTFGLAHPHDALAQFIRRRQLFVPQHIKDQHHNKHDQRRDGG